MTKSVTVLPTIRNAISSACDKRYLSLQTTFIDRSMSPRLPPSSRMFSNVLPYFCRGKVCRGFGRGSKELGVPTANFDYRVIDALPSELDCGIYYGLASVGFLAAVHKAVLSIGWNPYYKNDKKSVETHVLHDFGGNFYGEELRLVVLGHIRPEKDFSSVDELIAEIKNDIKIAEEMLDSNEYDTFRTHPFFAQGSSES